MLSNQKSHYKSKYIGMFHVFFSQDKDPRMLQLIIQRLGANVGDLHLNMTASYTPTNGGSAGMDSDATVNDLKF